MSFELIETVTLGSAAASIEFTSIPQDGTDLVLVFSLRAALGAGNQLFIRLNSSSSASGKMLKVVDGTVSSESNAGDRAGFTPTSSYTSNTFGSGECYISNYASSTNKSMSIDTVSENNSASVYKMSISGQSFTSTVGITAINMFISGDSIAQHSTASLYKITAA
jgi:hypothetical protein